MNQHHVGLRQIGTKGGCTLAELEAISGNHADAETHVIFVHGLSGDTRTTWTSTASIPPVLWPGWLSEDIAGLGIWLVGYPASKTNWGGIAMTLAERADNILARLLLETRLAKGNVIFVVHSLGGLVVEQLLRSAERDAASNRVADEFLSRVRRIAFLGTPHRGAILANIATTLRVFLLRPSAATRDLLLGSPQLKDLNRWYRKKSQANGIEHLVLAEGRPERVCGINLPETLGKVVWSDSADPGLPELSITVDESHTTICKPASREADVYVLVRDFIARPFAVSRPAQMAEAVESNTSQLKQLTSQSQEQTRALEAFTRAVESRPLVPAMDTAIIDAEVARQTERLRQCRFFAGFNTIEEARRLSVSLDSGALALASSANKSNALAWCARLLATTAPDEAQSTLDRITSPNHDLIEIARALIKQGSGNLADGLGLLAAIDTPMGRGAAYICVQKTKGFEEAEAWLQLAGLTTADLDSDSKLFHLGSALEAGAWDIAYEVATTLTTVDFDQTPAILRLAADACLARAVPDELRMLPRQYIPSNAATFPLRGEPDSLGHRRKAVELYDRLISAATALGMPVHAGDASDRSLWLRLRDPEQAADARSEMITSLRDPAVLLRRLNLAVQFGIEIDLQQVEKEVDRQTTLSGGTSPDAAVARLSLAFVQESHAAAASYVDKHRAQLMDHLEWKGVYFFEIEMLARSGQVAQAEVLLREAIGKGITPNEEDRLRRLLEEVAGNDPIGGRLAIYEKSRSIVDLRLLVDAYESARNWAKTAEYGKSLLALTGDIADAHRFVVALYNQERLEEVLSVFAEYTDLAVQYDQARLLYARTLFELGRVNEARLALDALRQTSDSVGARQLQVSLAVTSGDWESLQGFVESEWSNRLERAPKELLRAGQIAQLIGAARGKDLVREAAQRAEGDSLTLIGCYHAAVSAGWEESREVFQWFEQSAELSEQAGDGLVQKFSIEDIVDRKPAWDKREADSWSLTAKGEIPLFALGQILNRSLLNLFLLPALSNVDEPDVRRQPIVHAFCGARASLAFDPGVIAMDPTSLITAELLGVLGLYISTFGRIIIPHNTLGWLLEEKARILFHQPSRVAAARELRQMISDQYLQVSDRTSSAPDGLISEVGESLAALIAEASDPDHSDKRQRLVVRGGPIHRVSTFMKEEADLAGYMPYLCSAVDLVDKLAQKSVLTVNEAEEARDALRLREQPWPSSPDIEDGAVLYLDDVTVSHLQFLGLLQKLHRAGITAVVPQSEVEEANALIRHDASSAAVIKVVDGLRTNLKNALESGKVHLGRAIHVDDEDGPRGALAHPSVAILRLLDEADVGVSDDRFINQHLSISSATSTKPLLTTIDLLDSLQRRGALSAAKVLAARTAMRRANYALMPLSHKELAELISCAHVVNGVLVETAELRAIRESVQRIRMSDLLQFPKELPWLNSVLGVSLLVLKEQWTDDLDEGAAGARSDWLLKLSDVRGWTHRLNEGVQQLEDRYLNWVALLMMLAVAQSKSVKEAYWRWFGVRILNPIADENHKAFVLLLERAKVIIAQGVDYSAEELESAMDLRTIRGVLVQAALDLLPPEVQRALLEDKAFIRQWGIATTTSLAFEKDGPSFSRGHLYDSIRSAIRDLGSVFPVEDQNGLVWQLLAELQDEGLVFSLRSNEKHYSLMDHSALADDVSVRTGWFERTVPAIFFDFDNSQSWLRRMRHSPLSDDEFAELIAEIELTPTNIFRSLRAGMEQVNVDVTALVPHDLRYYEHLVGELGQSTTVAEYVESGAKTRISNLQSGKSRNGLSFALLMCSTASVAECIQIDALDRHELVQTYAWLADHGDPISRVGAVEVALSHLDSFPELGPFVEQIVEALLSEVPEDDSCGCALLCAMVVMTATELARKRTLGDVPPFYFRQAAIAHASLVIRAIDEARINVASVTRWAQASGIGQIYFLQGLIDLRREPRWLPDFVDAGQLRFEFIGRITNAAGRNESNIQRDSLRNLLLGPDSKLAQAAQWPFPHLPGPMEGAIASGRPYPEDWLREVEAALEADRLDAAAFAGLVNGALLFDMKEEMADLAAVALQRVRFFLENTDDKDKNFSLLAGLATLAATTRSRQLADALRMLTRVMRRRKRLSGDVDEELRVALVTAAAFEDPDEWARFAGEWLTEIAFEMSDRNAAKTFLHKLRRLVKMEPLLAKHCASADAALDAFAH